MRAIVLAAAVICSFAGFSGAVSAAPHVGERHADFTLADITTGKAVSLSDFRGKRVLLIQFASW
ncbi:MAG: hypothetical protein WD875_16870 [Pirellulales bacterium]